MKRLFCLMLALMCLSGCTAPNAAVPASDEVPVIRAMYVPLDSGDYVMIGENGEPFTLTFPEDMVSMDGNIIAREDISAGNIVALHGEVNMDTSWPGVLCGVTKAEVVDTGSPEDIEQYRSIIDKLAALREEPSDAQVNRAMYVPFGENSYVMIEENGQVYTVRFPSDMVDLNGNPITHNDLQAGNLLDIYGDGIMLESYPGQYPGVTRIKVADPGSPEDIKKYQDIIDELYKEPEPLTEPPALHLEYTVSQAVAYTQASMGNYQWLTDMGDGTTSAVVACGPHVLEWPDLCEVNIESAFQIRLTWPEASPQTVSCTRWPRVLYQTDVTDSIGASETSIEIAALEDGVYALDAEPDYVYAVYASWPEGSAEYGFITLNPAQAVVPEEYWK